MKYFDSITLFFMLINIGIAIIDLGFGLFAMAILGLIQIVTMLIAYALYSEYSSRNKKLLNKYRKIMGLLLLSFFVSSALDLSTLTYVILVCCGLLAFYFLYVTHQISKQYRLQLNNE